MFSTSLRRTSLVSLPRRPLPPRRGRVVLPSSKWRESSAIVSSLSDNSCLNCATSAWERMHIDFNFKGFLNSDQHLLLASSVSHPKWQMCRICLSYSQLAVLSSTVPGHIQGKIYFYGHLAGLWCCQHWSRDLTVWLNNQYLALRCDMAIV